MLENFCTTSSCLWKRIRKLVYALIVIVIIAAAGAGWLHYTTHVRGYVTAINGSQLTVSNKLFDRNVNISGVALNGAVIKIGEKIAIEENLSGKILSVKVGQEHKQGASKHHMNKKSHVEEDDDAATPAASGK